MMFIAPEEKNLLILLLPIGMSFEVTYDDTGHMTKLNLDFRGSMSLWPGHFFSITKCRTAGRHAGVDLTRSTPNRVLSVHRSIDTYRKVTLTVNSIFTQSLQFINSLYS